MVVGEGVEGNALFATVGGGGGGEKGGGGDLLFFVFYLRVRRILGHDQEVKREETD